MMRQFMLVFVLVGHFEQQAMAKGKSRIRGGHTLRDTLYAATANRRSKK
jgi:hypothetical protein